jgi:hypothetical protein
LLKKIAPIILLSILVAACQKTSETIVDTLQPINVQLIAFVGDDSIDIANYHPNNSPPFVISDSFLVTIAPLAGFSFLNVSVQNDSGNILFTESYSSLHGDSIGGTFYFMPASIYVGSLIYSFTAYNNDGTPGNYQTKVVRVFNSASNPPVVDSVSAPDSLMISTDTVTTVLTAYVHDPFGLNDISKVYFNVTKPDGTPSTGNPFLMYDDGGASHSPGDVDPTPNDGHYTLGISLPPNTTIGTYTFTFYASNRSGILSNPFRHKITVYK